MFFIVEEATADMQPASRERLASRLLRLTRKGNPLLLRAVTITLFYFFPTVQLIAGYAVSFSIPAFQRSAFEAPDPAIFVPIIFSLIASMIWILLDLSFVYNRETPINTLGSNCTWSTVQAIGIGMWLGNPMCNLWPWYGMIPMAFSLLDAIWTGRGALNNTAQRSLSLGAQK